MEEKRKSHSGNHIELSEKCKKENIKRFFIETCDVCEKSISFSIMKISIKKKKLKEKENLSLRKEEKFCENS